MERIIPRCRPGKSRSCTEHKHRREMMVLILGKGLLQVKLSVGHEQPQMDTIPKKTRTVRQGSSREAESVTGGIMRILYFWIRRSLE